MVHGRDCLRQEQADPSAVMGGKADHVGVDVGMGIDVGWATLEIHF